MLSQAIETAAVAAAFAFICRPGVEGLRLEAYQDQGGVWTLGRGTTYLPSGRPVGPKDTCTQKQADAWCQAELSLNAAKLAALAPASATAGQIGACLSFSYNLGLARLLHSTLWALFKSGAIADAADEFLKWNHVDGKVSAGLTKRRFAERAMFLGKELTT